MRNWKRNLLLLTVFFIVIGIFYVLCNFLFLDFIVDMWWFQSLGLKSYFMKRLWYRYLVFGGVAVSFCALFFLNFWIAKKLNVYKIKENESQAKEKQKFEKLYKIFQTGSLKFSALISLLLAIYIAIPFYEKWDLALLFFFKTKAGIFDPFYGKDISYYLFSYPVYTLIQNKLLIVFTVLLLLIAMHYWIKNRFAPKQTRQFSKGAKIHLTALTGFLFLISAWGFYLKRYALLYINDHQPVFFGPGFIEMRYNLPLIWGMLITFVSMAFTFLVYVHTKKGLKFLFLSFVLFISSIGFYNTTFLSSIIDDYFIKPDPLNKEKQFIKNNIEATLDAFALKELQTLQYPIDLNPDKQNRQEIKQSLHNIPVWDRQLLDDVYTQLQAIQPYYAFPAIDVDRYYVGNYYQQIYLGARELNLEKLPESARNWENSHLQYTHGHGVVMSPASQGGDEPMAWFIKGLNLKSDYGFTIKRPEIYYGFEKLNYCIVPNNLGEIGYLQKNSEKVAGYSGKGGILISSLLKKLLFAAYFKETKIFFSPNINKQSRVLFRRNIIERIKKITPFFALDNDPYLVITSEGVFFIQDAYCISSTYPNVQRYLSPFQKDGDLKNNKINYIRNSVKIVIDAFNGDVSYYVSFPDDPIIQTYQRIYPGLLKNIDQMPSEIKQHIRYPKDIFKMQMNVYGKYHQTRPEVFYQQADTWTLANMDLTVMDPYYVTTRLPESDVPEFLLLCPMSPLGRENMRAVAMARCDKKNYGKILIYRFPTEIQVNGPSQISALIAQNATISQKLTLWDQRGSTVKLGRMVILPTGKSVIYIQPLYLIATSKTKIPELKRIIVTQDNVTAMDLTLEAALLKVEEKLKERYLRMQKRYPIPDSQPVKNGSVKQDKENKKDEEKPAFKSDESDKEKPIPESDEEKPIPEKILNKEAS